ncbi:hypothetical protein N2152v2_002744 [Parachlorella kessleri]
MNTRIVALLGALLLASTCFAASELPAGLIQDRKALMALQQAVTAQGFGLSSMSQWKASANPCAPKPWAHLTCAGNRVIGLNLANLKVQGTLPPELKLANELITLNLQGNKFTGTIPDEWADPAYFLKLKTLNLQNNLLRGALPNRKWNRLGAFISLRDMDLSGNQFFGGLPDGWLSSAKVFKRLETLDLSKNLLGTSDGTTAYTGPYSTTAANDWCRPGVAISGQWTGWCATNGATPATPLAGTTAALRSLDLSDNGFQGWLPTNWGIMFPKLQYFLIHDNSLFATSAAATDTLPALLPTTWTSRTAPRKFPALQSLVLYPGNENICFLPDGTDRTLPDGTTFYGNGESFQDINGASSYQIVDSSDEAYDFNNPWKCPLQADADSSLNVPQAATAMTANNTVIFTGADSSVPTRYIYGYKVTVSYQNPDTLVWNQLGNGDGLLVKTYDGTTTPNPHIPASLGTAAVASNVYTVTFTSSALQIPKDSPTGQWAYKFAVTTLNMDGSESEAVVSTPSAFITIN